MERLTKKLTVASEARDVLVGDGVTPIEKGPCNNYRLDMTGDSFGICKCGYPRADHLQKAQRPTWAKTY